MMDLWAEWAVTSSVLILIVVLLRAVLGKRLRAGVRYVLWGLVLLRILVPVQLFAVPVYEAPKGEQPEYAYTPGTSLGGETLGQEQTRPDTPDAVPQIPGGVQTTNPGGSWDNTQTGERDPDPGVVPDPVEASGRGPVSFGALLLWIWLGGAIATGLILLHFNLHFAVTLRHERRPMRGAECRLPVYVMEGLTSPCLFGVFRPAVYLSPEAAEEPRMLRHVLSHEETHYRHADHIWSLLRCAALAAHWWNPLVWLAVSLSRRDGELFCDEGALKKLGDGERRAYGNTLLALVTAGPSASMLMSCATTMSGGKKALRERISRIAIPVKRSAWAVVLVLIAAFVAAAGAFIDPVEKPGDPTDTPDPTENPYPVPTVFPEGEPERVLSLRDLEPYAPPEVTNAGSFDGTAVVDSVTVGGHTVVLLENDQGQRAVAVTDGDEQRVFMTGLDQYDEIEAFEDVFGFEGVRVRHRLIAIYDYFRFTTGEPVLMLRTEAWSGEPVIADFDGDGRDEVVDSREIFFLRDGALYRADLETLLSDGVGHYRGSVCHAGERCVEWVCDVDSLDGLSSRKCTRLIYFDGEDLKVYKENKPWHDHVVDGVGEGIPPEVMAAAREYVEKEAIVQNPDGTYSEWSPYSQSVIGDALYDDWRIEDFSFDWQQTRDGGWTVEVYFFNYELHTTTPEKVDMAGSMYLTEDDWFCPTYPGCEMLVFKNDGGTRTFLWHAMNNDLSLGTPEFQQYLDAQIAQMGL